LVEKIHTLRNKFEKRIYGNLKTYRIKGKIEDFGYETERIPYVLAGHYIPDFIIETELGKVYVECKGYLRPEDKRKLIAVKKQHPELDLRLLFYADNPKNIKWAIKNGIKFAIHKIPREWLHGL